MSYLTCINYRNRGSFPGGATSKLWRNSLKLEEIDLLNSTMLALIIGKRFGGELITEEQLDGITYTQAGGASSI